MFKHPQKVELPDGSNLEDIIVDDINYYKVCAEAYAKEANKYRAKVEDLQRLLNRSKKVHNNV